MAMEDAPVLADCLRTADSVECALEAYVRMIPGGSQFALIPQDNCQSSDI